RAGLPTTSACAGTGLVITAPAPMKAYGPILLPQTIVALAPTVAPLPTCVASYLSRRTTALRGLVTLVNTQDGPRKTSSPQVTPVYNDTLFCTLTLLPNTTPGAITTFCPML